jgi:hypothetical protein
VGALTTFVAPLLGEGALAFDGAEGPGTPADTLKGTPFDKAPSLPF